MVNKNSPEYIYRNNNPGNIKVSSDWTGDFYIGTKGVEKYKKFDTKAMGLAAIIDTMRNYFTEDNKPITDIDKIFKTYATDDSGGKVIDDYGGKLKESYNVIQNVDYDDDNQLLNIMKGVTDLENKESANQYYTEKDYNDALKLYRESKLFEGQGTIDEQIKDAEMQGLNLDG
jgi:hypothetical protein|tara:strand:- start:31 stop:549 length:519 start_codon:yes stop_codon:yes gene_type:complete